MSQTPTSAPPGTGTAPRVLHLHDAAGTGERLVAAARARGLDWQQRAAAAPVLPTAAAPSTGIPASGPSAGGAGRSGPAATARGAATRARTALEQATRPLRARVAQERLRRTADGYDVLHVHGAHKAATAARVRSALAVHCHGSDVRLMLHDPRTGPSVRAGLEDADLVVYATPDLAEHVAPLRPDAHYLPVPVTAADLPAPPPDDEREGIVFASRWSAAKGGDRMLEIARRIRELDPAVPLLGIDWGEDAHRARELGVRLLPKQGHDAYLRSLATARVAVAQANPMIGTSELEALGLDLPLVGAWDADWYPGLPLLGGVDPAEQAEAALAAHRDVAGARAAQDGRGFVLREHATGAVLDRLLGLYAEVLDGEVPDGGA